METTGRRYFDSTAVETCEKSCQRKRVVWLLNCNLYIGVCAPGEAHRNWTGAPRSPGFPVKLGGVGVLHAAFLTESHTRSCPVQRTGNPGRLSVRGPRMVFFERFQLEGSAAPNGFSFTGSLKRSWASPFLFGPRTLRRTWGTRPVPTGFFQATNIKGPRSRLSRLVDRRRSSCPAYPG